MRELNLPHQAPVKFAKYIISKDETSAIVRVEFDSLPSLAMLIEAAAQSSAAFGSESTESVEMGFLVTLKNIKLLNEPSSLEYDAKITFEHKLNNLRYFNFEMSTKESVIASGTFVIAIG